MKFYKLISFIAPIASIAAIVSCTGKPESLNPKNKDSIIQLVGPNGHKDGAFQEVAWNGLIKGKKEFPKLKNVKELKASVSDSKGNMQAARSAIGIGAYTIFGNGEGFKFLASDEFAGKYKNREFLITDAKPKKSYPNLTSVEFASQQSSFLSAIGSAFYMTEHSDKFGGLNDLKVGFWGGAAYDSVNAFIAGFINGIKYFNDNFAKDAQKIEIVNDKFANPKNDSFSGSWGQDQNAEKMITALIDKKADVVFPVAGEQVKTAIAKAKQNKNLMIIGVDSDPRKTYGNDSKYFITSAIKNIDKATYEFTKILFANQKSETLKIHQHNELGFDGNFVSAAEGLLKTTQLKDLYNIKISGNIFGFINNDDGIKQKVKNVSKTWY